MAEILRAQKADMSAINKNADIADFDFADTDNRFELEGKVKGALRGSSLFSSDKLTVIRNYWGSARKRSKASGDESAKLEDDSKTKNDFESFLLSTLEKVSVPDRIILIENRDLDKRGKAYKLLEKLSKEKRLEKKEFVMPLGFKFNAWLEERFRTQGGRIDRANLDLLAMLLGRGMEQKERSGELVAAYDLHQAAGEIDKLITYADGSEVSKDDVLLLVSGSEDMNIFNLIESIAKRDKGRALSILSGQLRKGFNENYVLTMLVYHFRNLISIKSLLAQNLSAGEIASRTKIHPMVVEKNIRYARALGEEHLVLIYDKLHGADLSIKTGRMEPELALDILIAAI